MKRLLRTALLTALLTKASAAWGLEPEELAACSSVADETKRLRCYDELTKKVTASTALGTARATERVSNRKRNSPWRYSDFVDKMDNTKVEVAKTMTTEAFEFDAPYRGPQRATLMLRRRAGNDEWDIMLSIERGQFLSGDSYPVRVRFGDGKPALYNASAPADHSSTMVFIENYLMFQRGLKSSTKLLIQASFYQEGSRTFEFDVSDLEWEIPKLVGSNRDCRATFDCPITEKCGASKKCVLCDLIEEQGACADQDRR